MIVTYDRYMRDYRAKLLKAKLERQPTPDTEAIPGVRIALMRRAAVKQTMRGMEGQ